MAAATGLLALVAAWAALGSDATTDASHKLRINHTINQRGLPGSVRAHQREQELWHTLDLGRLCSLHIEHLLVARR